MDEAALDAQNEVEVVEQYEISDDEADEFDYDAVEAPDDDDDDDDDDEDFAAALASVQRLDEKSRAGSTVASQRDIGTPAAKPTLTQVRPEVVDDFIRNFLIKVGMSRTLDNFNSEWYDLQQKGKLAEVYTDTVPDIYVRNQDLDERVVALQQQLDKMRIITEKAQGTWDKFRKERDFHRMHHRRVVQEKAKLTTDLQRLRKHYLSYEPTLKDLQKKYEVAMKEKMLTRLERDRIKARVHTLEAQVQQLQAEKAAATKAPATPKPPRPKRGADSKLPPRDSVPNPYASLTFDPPGIERYQLRRTFKGHVNAVSAAAFHPHKPILVRISASVSDLSFPNFSDSRRWRRRDAVAPRRCRRGRMRAYASRE
jgi:plasmid maintenance system antidote protein VapI